MSRDSGGDPDQDDARFAALAGLIFAGLVAVAVVVALAVGLMLARRLVDQRGNDAPRAKWTPRAEVRS